MARRPKHFYEAMGEERVPRQIAKSRERSAEPMPPVPPPVQVVPVQNTITIRKETFIAGIVFFIVIVVVAFLVGRSTAPSPSEKDAVEKEVVGLKPTLLADEKFAILAATFPLSRLREAEEIKDELVKIGWTNARIQKEGETVFLLLTPYRTNEKAKQALEAIKKTSLRGREIFKGARLLER